MQEDERKFPFRCWEIVSMSVLVPIIYLTAVLSIFGKEYNLPWRMVSDRLVVFMILGLDMTWIILMKFWPLKNTRAKVLLTLLVLTLSAIGLTDLYLIHTWHKMW